MIYFDETDTSFDEKEVPSSCLERKAFEWASLGTDPICRVHEIFRRICIAESRQQQLFLSMKMLGFVALSTFLTIPSAFLRAAAVACQKKSFLFSRKEGDFKELKECSFSVLSWNICCVGGGYSISDGGVAPWQDRIDAIVEKIEAQDAEIVCLYETFDTTSALYLEKKLQEMGYRDIYLNIGALRLGVSSGMLVASKYRTQRADFTPFSQEILVGRTKMAAKGVFSLDFFDEKGPFARGIFTHLQHSELPEFPEEEEVIARQRQMSVVLEKAQEEYSGAVFVTGDLNLDDEEYERASWNQAFEKDPSLKEKSWGGDGFCARLVGKPVSGPLNLDHTILLRGTARKIETTLVETGFQGDVYSSEALSDHKGLFSQIFV